MEIIVSKSKNLYTNSSRFRKNKDYLITNHLIFIRFKNKFVINTLYVLIGFKVFFDVELYFHNKVLWFDFFFFRGDSFGYF